MCIFEWLVSWAPGGPVALGVCWSLLGFRALLLVATIQVMQGFSRQDEASPWRQELCWCCFAKEAPHKYYKFSPSVRLNKKTRRPEVRLDNIEDEPNGWFRELMQFDELRATGAV
jgi:hypothetical protein